MTFLTQAENLTFDRFSSGLTQHLAQFGLPFRYRWHPLDSSWYSYTLDTGPYLVDRNLGSSTKIVIFGFADGQRTVGNDIQDLFNATQAHYRQIQGAAPHSVWDPLTGDWRAAVLRQPDQTHPPGHSVSPELQARIQQVHQLVADRAITPEQGNIEILKLLAEGI